MAAPLTLPALDQLPRTPATEVKNGWRSLMRTVGRTGKVVITLHDTPEAVVLSAEEYGAIASALQAAAERGDPALEALRRRFDDRLAALRAPDANARLRGVMAGGLSHHAGKDQQPAPDVAPDATTQGQSPALPRRLSPSPLRLDGAVIAGAKPTQR